MRCSNINTIRTISHTFSSTAWPDTITRSHIIIHAPAWPHAPTTHAVDVTHPRFEPARRPRSAFTVARIKVEPPPVPSGCPVNSTRPMANESAVAQLSDYRLPTLRANACLTWWWLWCQCGVVVVVSARGGCDSIRKSSSPRDVYARPVCTSQWGAREHVTECSQQPGLCGCINCCKLRQPPSALCTKSCRILSNQEQSKALQESTWRIVSCPGRRNYARSTHDVRRSGVRDTSVSCT